LINCRRSSGTTARSKRGLGPSPYAANFTDALHHLTSRGGWHETNYEDEEEEEEEEDQQR
jgi:hypothetical protein